MSAWERFAATIFDPLIQFPQDDNPRKRLSTSLGLGLFIAEQIVQPADEAGSER